MNLEGKIMSCELNVFYQNGGQGNLICHQGNYHVQDDTGYFTSNNPIDDVILNKRCWVKDNNGNTIVEGTVSHVNNTQQIITIIPDLQYLQHKRIQVILTSSLQQPIHMQVLFFQFFTFTESSLFVIFCKMLQFLLYDSSYTNSTFIKFFNIFNSYKIDFLK